MDGWMNGLPVEDEISSFSILLQCWRQDRKWWTYSVLLEGTRSSSSFLKQHLILLWFFTFYDYQKAFVYNEQLGLKIHEVFIMWFITTNLKNHREQKRPDIRSLQPWMRTDLKLWKLPRIYKLDYKKRPDILPTGYLVLATLNWEPT